MFSSRTDILEKSAFFFYKLVLSENFSRLEFLKGIFIVLDSFEELLATYIPLWVGVAPALMLRRKARKSAPFVLKNVPEVVVTLHNG